MATYKYTVVLEKNENGGYTVNVPALRGCVTEGDTIAEALANAREAVECYLESLIVDGEPFPHDVKEAIIPLEDIEEALVFKVWVHPEVELAKAAWDHREPVGSCLEADGLCRGPAEGQSFDPQAS